MKISKFGERHWVYRSKKLCKPIIKLLKPKKKKNILKAAREIPYRGTEDLKDRGFLIEAKRKRNTVFQVLKKTQSWVLQLVRIPFRKEWENQTYSDKGKQNLWPADLPLKTKGSFPNRRKLGTSGKNSLMGKNRGK